ncbi:MAG: hypothetical protein OXC68_13070, partial [Aestuariivita sp.]|nr:hypothetical protein [Aestuariivita sp.]
MTPHHPQADSFTHAQWYALGRDKDFPNDRKTHTRLLSQDLIVVRKDHTLEVTLSQGQPRPIQHQGNPTLFFATFLLTTRVS